MTIDESILDQIKIRDSIISLKHKVEMRYGEDCWDEYLHEGRWSLDNLVYAGVAYEPLVTQVEIEQANRLSSMFAGPFFTSTKYPWPRNRSGKLGAPIVQIDLESTPCFTEEKLGNGLLQAWRMSGFKDYFLRVVPRDDLRMDVVTPLPEISKIDDVVQLHKDWEMPWLSEGVSQISGYGPPFFSCAFSDFSIVDDAPEDIRQIAHFFSQLNIDTRSYQIFGTFDQIQFDHASVGASLLISMSNGEYGIDCFGYAGTGQIFYRKNIETSAIDFFMDSSC